MIYEILARKLKIEEHHIHMNQDRKGISRSDFSSYIKYKMGCILDVWYTYKARNKLNYVKVNINKENYTMLRSPPWLGWPLWNICVTNDHGYVPFVVNTSRSFPHSRLTTGFVTRLTRRVPLVEQELLTLPEHLISSPVLSGVRVARSLVLYVCFVDRCLSFCTFSFGHCVVCSSSIYGFWLPLWYLQTLLTCGKDLHDRFI